ncbi:DUF2813 domain-containing protein [Spirabiliibacterium falconis]|uniref:DUF2813 domain-containing protein n=1 Tax=Spirabiliibacterium falconis TaxID=572023 RepID=UPI001AAD7853|nr:DUF2813 domain-containing protein [Spirabiliibacterium falconis]MBE2894065.1 DUF2813 domain-containing protein [Spirabiliibacterium falconis]
MYLKQIDIAGFRGLNRLSISLRSNMVLVGENAWGKSSLLDALSLILNPSAPLYQFEISDFHLTEQEHHAFVKHKIAPTTTKNCTLLFIFSVSDIDEPHFKERQCYKPLFCPHDDRYARIYLRVSAELTAGKVSTNYSFLNQNGDVLDVADKATLIKTLIAQHPVLRFRDARLAHKSNFQLKNLPDKIPAKEMQAIFNIIHYYFLQSPHALLMTDSMQWWATVKQLNQALAQDKNGTLRKQLLLALMRMFKQGQQLNFERYTRPIILLEDLEARLHPRMVAIAWEFARHLPIQRITTTNSVELLSYVKIEHICRLVRRENITYAYQLARHDLSSNDHRKLGFHIHYNRSLALFARAWLLVEGETEVWLMSELAEILNINLEMEGIRIIDFAQCGVRPLIKYCQKMGIEWFVLTDGDSAGRKYYDTVKSKLAEQDSLVGRVITLPERDIEHYFFHNGFAQVFYRLAKENSLNKKMNATKLIQKAISHSSKPDLALALANEIKKQGADSVPSLFKQMFFKLRQLIVM